MSTVHRVAMLGFGTVGKGFCEIVKKKKDLLARKFDLTVKVVSVCDMHKGSVYCPDGLDVDALLKHDEAGKKLDQFDNNGAANMTYGYDAMETCEKVDADSLCEVTFTNLTDGMPSIDFVKTALNNKKNVITTNKGPVVFALDELNELAGSKNQKFMIEGSIMSGTPIVSLMRILPACEYTEISGILNGTCNYILDSMENDGVEFDAALKEAQRLGYAEADPSFDVGGGDARAKAIILTRLLGDKFDTDKIFLEGIEGITKSMVDEAAAEKKRWKLISQLKLEGGKVQEVSVKPMLLDKATQSLANVGGALNALNFSTDMLGPDLTMIGPGAGKIETGYSLFSDMLYLCGKQTAP